MFLPARAGILLVLGLLVGFAVGAAPFAYIADDGASNVSVIDTANNAIVATISGVGTVPEGVAVNPAGTRVYVTNSVAAGTVAVIDTSTNTVIATVPVGAAPFAKYYQKRRDTSAEFIDEPNPKTLASAIKIGAPVSWKKALRAVDETGGVVLTVTEQEIADAKAIIGRDGIGCEPASATTVAGIKKMKAEGIIQQSETVVAVLTGHLLKDTDYVNKYHNNSLAADQTGILSTYGNMPIKVSGGRDELRDVIEELQKE